MIGTIINYCTNDFRFLSACLAEARLFSKEIVIPVADHFFDGTPENRSLLHHSYKAHPDCTFIEYAFSPTTPYGRYAPITPEDPNWIHYWHSTSRYIGAHFLSADIEYILFLDVDEIADRERFREWLDKFPYRSYEAVRFTHYFYFRGASFRAKKWMRNPLLLRRESLEKELLLDPLERRGHFLSIRGSKIEDVGGCDGNPLFHHYSWVRSKEEMLKKSQSWGHHADKNWAELIEEELREPFALRDKFWGISYEEVPSLFDPLSVELPAGEVEGPFPNVVRIDRRGLLEKQVWDILK